MRWGRVSRATVAALVAATTAPSLSACGDDDNAVYKPREGGVAVVEGGAIIDGAVEFPDAAAADAGAFSVVDVPDTPCTAPGGTSREIYAADATTFRPLRVTAIGARLAMDVDDGFVLMDGDGQNPSAQIVAAPFSVNATGSSPATLFGLGGTAQLLQAARFDSTGAALPAIDIGAANGASAIGGGEGTVLVALLQDTQLRARAFTAEGVAVAPMFTFRQGVSETNATAFDVVHAGGTEYGIAFAGEGAGNHRLVFTRVSTKERVGTSFTLLSGPSPLRLVQLARVGTGFAVLLERRVGAAPAETLVVILDAAGRISAPVLRLLGVRSAFGLASAGGEIGVLALRARVDADAGADETDPDAVEFRPFAAAGTPLGPWVCLDVPFTAPTVDLGAAILGDETGYRVLMRTPAHAVTFSRFNRLGTGS